jgi:hypothetical protein
MTTSSSSNVQVVLNPSRRSARNSRSCRSPGAGPAPPCTCRVTSR